MKNQERSIVSVQLTVDILGWFQGVTKPIGGGKFDAGCFKSGFSVQVFACPPTIGIRFLALSGFRSGESCALRWEQVDLQRGVLTYYNAKVRRWEPFPMDEELMRFFEKLTKEYSPFVFRYRNKSTLSVGLKTVTRELGLSERLRVHSLKATYVSKLIRAGVNQAYVHKLSHHRSLSTTLRYYAAFDLSDLRNELARSR